MIIHAHIVQLQELLQRSHHVSIFSSALSLSLLKLSSKRLSKSKR